MENIIERCDKCGAVNEESVFNIINVCEQCGCSYCFNSCGDESYCNDCQEEFNEEEF